MRICARLHKGEGIRFISHLGVQRLVQRAMRRAQLPLRYSQGFNPHPLLSFASALSLGYTSDAEWMDVRLDADMPPASFIERLNAALPPGMRVLEALELEEGFPALTAKLQRVRYLVRLWAEPSAELSALQAGIHTLLAEEILVEKRTKGGLKTVDIRPMVLEMQLVGEEAAVDPAGGAVLRVRGVLNASGGLNMELLLQSYLRACGLEGRYTVHREAMEFEGIGEGYHG